MNSISNKDFCSSEIIINKITDFKQKGLLNNVFDVNLTRSVATDTSLNAEIQYFLNNTENCVGEIQEQEKGEEMISLLGAIYGEKTVGEVYDAMLGVSPELASEYENLLIENYNNVTSDRSINNISSIRNVNLSFSSEKTSNLRAVDTSESYTTASVIGYVAACATVIAGLLVWKCGGFPWTKIAGLIAAGVGVAVMGTFILLWQKSTDWLVFQEMCTLIFNAVMKYKQLYSDISSGYSKEFLADVLNGINTIIVEEPLLEDELDDFRSYISSNFDVFKSAWDAFLGTFEYCIENNQMGTKTLTVLLSTVAVVGVALYSKIHIVVQNYMNAIMEIIPDWLSFSGNGFVLKWKF